MSKHLKYNNFEAEHLTLGLDHTGQRVQYIKNHRTETCWFLVPGFIFELDPKVEDDRISIELTISPLLNGQIELRFILKNLCPEPLEIRPMFPVLRGVSPGGEPSELGYCFPQLIPEISQAVASWRRAYGGLFPLQFMNLFHPTAGSLTLMTQDLTNENKEYWIEKKESGGIDFGVTYPRRTLLADEVWELPPAVIDAHAGDWHDGLKAYRTWVNTWYNPTIRRKPWFQEVFNLRQHFLHENLGDQAWNPESGKYRFQELLKEDIEAFGGVDYIQLFDWTSDPVHGRVGEYNPWEYLGGSEALAREIRTIQAMGIRVGLYLEGYLLDKRATVAKEHGLNWTVKSKENEPYYQMGGNYWHPCPHIPEWRDYLINVVGEAYDRLRADGIYIDQYGWGNQYICHCTEHGHPNPSNQIIEENQMITGIRKALSNEVVLLSEYCPTDVSTQYQDGSYTYAKGIINLTRFALPDFKLFVIIRCDEPIGNDFKSVKRIFFNGEGIWLEGPLSNPHWFPQEIRRLLRKCYFHLRMYRDAFTSADPIPLVETLNSSLLANQFPGQDRIVWTLYNLSDTDLEGELLNVPHSPDARYFDSWNNKKISVQIKDGEAYLTFRVKAKDVGCIVQEFNVPLRNANNNASALKNPSNS